MSSAVSRKHLTQSTVELPWKQLTSFRCDADMSGQWPRLYTKASAEDRTDRFRGFQFTFTTEVQPLKRQRRDIKTNVGTDLVTINALLYSNHCVLCQPAPFSYTFC